MLWRSRVLLGLLAAATATQQVRAAGPPDWFGACESTNATVVAAHCCNSTHRSGCNLRVMRKPNGTDTKDKHAARFPTNKPWTLQYEYKVPHKPSGPDWVPSDEIYFIWGDTDFDSYGLAPRAEFPMSRYIYNQIVPQLVLGNALATGGPSSNYKPGWIVFNDWAVQAQYYWSSCSKADGRRCAEGHSTSFASCGPAVNVSAGDTIETVISYEPSSGAITASIGAKGAPQQSVVHVPRPFPNESPPLWKSWREFFEAAQKLSQPSVGEGVLNHADFNIGA